MLALDLARMLRKERRSSVGGRRRVVFALAALVALVVVAPAAARFLAFTVQNYPIEGSSGYGVATGDFNGDGRLDVVSADSDSTIEYFKGKANGKLADPVAV